MACQCPICFEEISGSGHCLPCGHIFCTVCVESLARSVRTRSGQVSCPSCRRLYIPRMSAEVVRRVFLNSNNPSDSSSTAHPENSTTRPIVANDAEVSLLREQLNTAQRQRTEAVGEANRLNDVLGTIRRESMSKSNEINSLKQQLRDNASAFERALNNHTSYRASAEGIFQNFQNENNRLKCEITELKAELRIANSRFQDSQGRAPAVSTATQSILGSSSSSIIEESPSAHVQSQQTARTPTALNGRVIRTGNVSNTNNSLSAPAVPPVSTAPHPSPMQAQAPRTRALKLGADILYKSRKCPQRTPVPECTSADGYHDFSGIGSNQHATRYTCKECHFRCSESR